MGTGPRLGWDQGWNRDQYRDWDQYWDQKWDRERGGDRGGGSPGVGPGAHLVPEGADEQPQLPAHVHRVHGEVILQAAHGHQAVELRGGGRERR